MNKVEKIVVWLGFVATAAALILTEYSKTVEILEGNKSNAAPKSGNDEVAS